MNHLSLHILMFAVPHLYSHGPSASGIPVSFSCVSVHVADRVRLERPRAIRTPLFDHQKRFLAGDN